MLQTVSRPIVLVLLTLALLASCGQAPVPSDGGGFDVVFGDLSASWLDAAGAEVFGLDSALADGDTADAIAALDDADGATPDDAVPPDGSTADASQSCEFAANPSAGQPGAVCNGPSDCDSGYCLEGPTGKICSKACIDCCPTGFKCEQYGGSGDLTFVCSPKWTALCRPCDTDAECAASGKDALCVSYGEAGSFCAAACTNNSDCPGEYNCAQASGEKGAGQQCVRTSGECGCSPSAIAAGAHTTCHKQNEAGTCSGVRKCSKSGLSACPASVPMQEQCGNAVDDNCDGATDEDKAAGCTPYFVDKDGDGDGLAGSAGTCMCAPTALYTAVTAVDCNDVDAKLNQWAVEICDGVDNNCNAKTDEGCDDDGDGYCDGSMLYFPAPVCPKGGNDCDDGNATNHPGTLELCGNAQDDDCDGLTDAGKDVDGCVAFYEDDDGDGYGTGAASCLCSAKGLFTSQKNGDCNDSAFAVHPGQAEQCGNEADDDCDGQTDEEGSTGCSDYWLDADKDGFGTGTPACLCAADLAHSATQSGDCDDAKVAVYPGAAEACNGADDNCDGATDEVDATGCSVFYVDGDGDGFGDGATGLCLCAKNALSSTADGSDCNDAQAAIHVGAAELCDGVDNDCDGATDGSGTADCQVYYADQDGDGFGVGASSACMCAPAGLLSAQVAGDCDDTATAVHPGGLEVCDGIDNNCANGTDELAAAGCKVLFRDADADGFGVTGDSQCLCSASGVYTAKQGEDCDDTSASVHPKATEVCNSIDDDCDGVTDPAGADGCALWFVDGDGDGYGTYLMASKCVCNGLQGYANVGGDCADADFAVHPGAAEACNGKDDNCDQQVDPKDATGCVPYYFDGDKDGYGLSSVSQCQCAGDAAFSTTAGGDCNDGNAAVSPGTPEICNSADENCNGQADEGLPLTKWYPDADKDGYGVGSGVSSCGAVTGMTAKLGGDCNDASAAANPGIAAETCGDKLDNNCSGATDEGCNTCTGGKSPMNGVCVDLTTATLNAGGREVVSGPSISLYIVPPGNLLVNSGAETNDLTGWVKPNGYDDWSVTSTDYGLPVPFGARVFRPSYSTSYLAQTVDLVAASVPTSGLSTNTPLQYGAFAMGWGCKDTLVPCSGGTSYSDDSFGLDVTFQDAAGAQLNKWTGATNYMTIGVWASAYQNDTTYPTGTRKVVVQVHGADGEGWGGYYGPSIDGAFLIYGKLDMRVSNDGATWSAWQPFQPVVTGWALIPGAGVKTVRVEFRDGTGVSLGTNSDTVTLQ